MRMIFVVLFLFCNCLAGCTISAQPMTAAQVAQTSNPKILVEKKWNKARLEIGSNFRGNVDVDATYNKDGTFHVKGSGMIDSDVGGVVKSEGDRAMQLTPLMTEQMRMIERLDAGLTERHRIVGQNMQAAGTMFALAATAGGDALKKVIDATAPILAGSGGSLDLGTLGGGSFNLGGGFVTPITPPTVGTALPPGSTVTEETTPTTKTKVTTTTATAPEGVMIYTREQFDALPTAKKAAYLNRLGITGVTFAPPVPVNP